MLKYPKPKNAATTKSMRGNKSKNTKPELAFRAALWAAGLRGYRVHYAKAPGRPDIAFVGKKIAIFLHGCYWHRCPYCNLEPPKNNSDYWTKKFAYNKERDERAIRELKALGWKALVFWECRFKKNPAAAIKKVLQACNG